MRDRTAEVDDLAMIESEIRTVSHTVSSLWALPHKDQGAADALESAQKRLAFLLNDHAAAKSRLSGPWTCGSCGAVTTSAGARLFGSLCLMCGGTLSR